MCSLSLSLSHTHNASHYVRLLEYLSWGMYKERNHGKNPSSAIWGAKHGYKSDVWEKGGYKINSPNNRFIIIQNSEADLLRQRLSV